MTDSVINRGSGGGFRLSKGLFYVSAVVTGVGILAKGLSWFGVVGSAADALVIIAFPVGLLLLPRVTKLALIFERAVAVLFALAATAIVLLVPPLMASVHAVGRGTDEGDCIRVAAHRLAGGLWPYSIADMRTHNPLACGPAWVGLHTPLLQVLSYPLVMLTLIVLSIAAVGLIAGLDRALRFSILLGLIPGAWLALANGNDFATFGVVLGASIVVITSPRVEDPFVGVLLMLVVVAVSQARLPFLVLPAVLLSQNKGKSWWFGLAAQIASVVLWLSFFWHNQNSFLSEGPMYLLVKAQLYVSATAHLWVTPGLFLAILTLGAIGLFILARFVPVFSTATCAQVFLIAVCGGMGIVDLIAKIIASPGVVEALTYWEGTSWLTGVGCLAACNMSMDTSGDVSITGPSCS